MIGRLLPDTVVSRAVAILIAALLAVHVIGYFAYRAGVGLVAGTAQDRALAERIVSIKRAVATIPDEGERDKTAHALSSASLEVHWSRISLVRNVTPLTDRASATAARLKELVPDLEAESFRIAFADDGAVGSSDADRHMLLISVRLDDQSWVNFSAAQLGTVVRMDLRVMIFALCIGIVIVAIAGLLLRWATRPLSDLALAAERFSLDSKPEPLSEGGPQEVRRAAKAFNTMRDRIQNLVGERTQALAAVSHDLRTPITRVRLRSEAIDDDATRELIDQDLAEMESMIEQTLEFLRVGDSGEARRLVDLASIANTIVDDAQDAGREAVFSGIASLPVKGQPVALKRALGNIIGNALKYASRVEVEARVADGSALIVVRDDGPGIPVNRIESVFEPFVRLEGSRNKETGGVGLGLTIARSIVAAHRGDVVLRNRPEGGLEAIVSLPSPAGIAFGTDDAGTIAH
jgi:signal transduction histidine kinase